MRILPLKDSRPEKTAACRGELAVNHQPPACSVADRMPTFLFLLGVSYYLAVAVCGSPEFAHGIRNVTVAVGKEAVLSCIINDLAGYKVGWMRADDQTILTLNRRVVTHNPRVSLTHEDFRTWNLHIRQVKPSDEGCYACQINTPLMKQDIGCIEVQVPPDIVDENSTSDLTVHEGDNATLICAAKGKPPPKIIWRREDGLKIPIFQHSKQRSREMEEYHGEILHLTGVTHRSMGAYMCIAQNGVPPSISKRVVLSVNFAPMVTAGVKMVGAELGSEVRLQCTVDSYPASVRYWMKGRTKSPSSRVNNYTIIVANAKNTMKEERNGSYAFVMTLVIGRFESLDQGNYICMARNSLGSAEASIQLYELTKMATPSSTARPTVTTSVTLTPTTPISVTTTTSQSRWIKGTTAHNRGSYLPTVPSSKHVRKWSTSSAQTRISSRLSSILLPILFILLVRCPLLL